MKYFIIFEIIAFSVFSGSMTILPSPSDPATCNLATELDAIIPIQRLADEQFQAFVRIINSNDGYITQMHFRSQPEVIDFINWVRSQNLEKSEEFLRILNRTPFESNTVSAWQDFVNEFRLYNPEDMIRSHVQMKLALNRIYEQFVQRLQALRPVFDRITALPEVQRLVAILEAKGINTTALDTFIRNLFGWQNSRTIFVTTIPDEVGKTEAEKVDVGVTLNTDLPYSTITTLAS